MCSLTCVSGLLTTSWLHQRFETPSINATPTKPRALMDMNSPLRYINSPSTLHPCLSPEAPHYSNLALWYLAPPLVQTHQTSEEHPRKSHKPTNFTTHALPSTCPTVCHTPQEMPAAAFISGVAYSLSGVQPCAKGMERRNGRDGAGRSQPAQPDPARSQLRGLGFRSRVEKLTLNPR